MTGKDNLDKDRLFEGEAYKSVTHRRPEPGTAPPTELPQPEAQDQNENPSSEYEHPQQADESNQD